MSDKNDATEFKVPSRMSFPDSLDSPMSQSENMDILKHGKCYVFGRRNKICESPDLLVVVDSSELHYNRSDMIASFGETDNPDFDMDKAIKEYIESSVIKIAYETRQKDLKAGDLMLAVDSDEFNAILDSDDYDVQLHKLFDLPENADKIKVLTEDDFSLALCADEKEN